METVSDLFTPQTIVQFNTATNFMCFKKEKKIRSKPRISLNVIINQ